MPTLRRDPYAQLHPDYALRLSQLAKDCVTNTAAYESVNLRIGDVYVAVAASSSSLITLRAVKVFAHRGASTQYAEHTRAAYTHALAVGADGIETDVQLTADGHLICWHDATLNRTSDGRGPLESHTLAQLRQLDVHSWKTRTADLPAEYGDATNQLVTLDELTLILLEANRPVELAVELKITPANAGHLEDAALSWLQRWGWDPTSSTLYPGGNPSQVQISLMSFSRRAVEHLAQTVPARYVCPLFHAHDGHALQLGASPAPSTGPAELLGPSTSWLAHHASVLRRWTREGRTVRMWTVATDRQFQTARELGVQQVTVDDPQWALHKVQHPLSV